ncbi:MAG: hypothetical protein WB755_16880, partial [Terriglobales bacterium]
FDYPSYRIDDRNMITLSLGHYTRASKPGHIGVPNRPTGLAEHYSWMVTLAGYARNWWIASCQGNIPSELFLETSDNRRLIRCLRALDFEACRIALALVDYGTPTCVSIKRPIAQGD